MLLKRRLNWYSPPCRLPVLPNIFCPVITARLFPCVYRAGNRPDFDHTTAENPFPVYNCSNRFFLTAFSSSSFVHIVPAINCVHDRSRARLPAAGLPVATADGATYHRGIGPALLLCGCAGMSYRLYVA